MFIAVISPKEVQGVGRVRGERKPALSEARDTHEIAFVACLRAI